MVIPALFEVGYETPIFSEGLVAVQQAGKWGFADRTGNMVIPFQYDGAGKFTQGFGSVMMNATWGFIDKSGKLVTPYKYEDVPGFELNPPSFSSKGLADVFVWGENDRPKYGYIDVSGKEVLPCIYDRIFPCSDFLIAKSNEKYHVFQMITATESKLAYPSTQTVLVDGKPVVFNAYALKDANGNDTNYVKLRDLGSALGFLVDWNPTDGIIIQTK